MTITVSTVGLDEVRELLRSLPGHMFEVAKRETARSLFEIQSKIVLPMSVGRFGLQSRSGNLARSIKFKTEGATLNTIKGAVFTKSIYAPLHEEGGTINAKNAYQHLPGGPFLNIPADDNRTPAGVMREAARTVFETGGFIVRINAPKAQYMVIKEGRVMFWLVKSVTIGPSLKMVSTTLDEVPTLLSNLNNALLEGL